MAGAWGPSWCWVPLVILAFWPSGGSGIRWSSVTAVSNASMSLFPARSPVAAACFRGVVTKRWHPIELRGAIHSSSWFHTAVPASACIVIAVTGAQSISAVVLLPFCRSPYDLQAYPFLIGRGHLRCPLGICGSLGLCRRTRGLNMLSLSFFGARGCRWVLASLSSPAQSV